MNSPEELRLFRNGPIPSHPQHCLQNPIIFANPRQKSLSIATTFNFLCVFVNIRMPKRVTIPRGHQHSIELLCSGFGGGWWWVEIDLFITYTYAGALKFCPDKGLH